MQLGCKSFPIASGGPSQETPWFNGLCEYPLCLQEGTGSRRHPRFDQNLYWEIHCWTPKHNTSLLVKMHVLHSIWWHGGWWPSFFAIHNILPSRKISFLLMLFSLLNKFPGRASNLQHTSCWGMGLCLMVYERPKKGLVSRGNTSNFHCIALPEPSQACCNASHWKAES